MWTIAGVVISIQYGLIKLTDPVVQSWRVRLIVELFNFYYSIFVLGLDNHININNNNVMSFNSIMEKISK